MPVQSLGWEDPLEEEMAALSRILAWRIPWTGEPCGVQSTACTGVCVGVFKRVHLCVHVCVHTASTELLSHVWSTVLWGPPTRAREGFIQRSCRNVDGQTSKGQSEEGGRSHFHRPAFCKHANCSVKATETKLRSLSLLGPSSDDGALGFQRTSLPLFAHPRRLCFCDECGCLSCLLRFQGSPLVGQAHLGRSQEHRLWRGRGARGASLR